MQNQTNKYHPNTIISHKSDKEHIERLIILISTINVTKI